MPIYESTFIVRQDISSQEVKKVTSSFTEIIEKFQGKILKEESWGLRNLAYKIKKNRKGSYVFLIFEASAEALKELRYRYLMNENVIRELTIRVDNYDGSNSPMVSDNSSE